MFKFVGTINPTPTLKKALFIFYLLTIPYIAISQLVLGISDKVDNKTVIDFTISEIIDSTSENSIGKVYLADGKRTTPVRLSGNIKKYFATLAGKIRHESKRNESILLIINKLSLIESKNGNVLDGKVQLTVSYYLNNSESKAFLLKKTSSTAYKRTFGSATPKSFENLIASLFTQNITFFSNWKSLNQTYHPAFVNKSEIIITPPFLQNTKDTIFYGSRPITWDDFKGNPKQKSRYAAAIFASIAFDLEMEIKDGILKAYFTPKVYMVPEMSWVRSSSLNHYSLEHERLHFDIAKITMNRYVQRVKQIDALTPEDLQSRIQFEYLAAYREMNYLQELYDDETGHGTNKLTQSFWRVQANKWLKE